MPDTVLENHTLRRRNYVKISVVVLLQCTDLSMLTHCCLNLLTISRLLLSHSRGLVLGVIELLFNMSTIAVHITSNFPPRSSTRCPPRSKGPLASPPFALQQQLPAVHPCFSPNSQASKRPHRPSRLHFGCPPVEHLLDFPSRGPAHRPSPATVLKR